MRRLKQMISCGVERYGSFVGLSLDAVMPACVKPRFLYSTHDSGPLKGLGDSSTDPKVRKTKSLKTFLIKRVGHVKQNGKAHPGMNLLVVERPEFRPWR